MTDKPEPGEEAFSGYFEVFNTFPQRPTFGWSDLDDVAKRLWANAEKRARTTGPIWEALQETRDRGHKHLEQTREAAFERIAEPDWWLSEIGVARRNSFLAGYRAAQAKDHPRE
jgi:hypothetical protein